MKITFLGTRGYIEARNDRHRRHTATLVEYRGAKLMIDCGLDWEEEVFEIDPDLIAITHAHPDHAFGLKDTAPCPVHATQTSWDKLGAEGLARFPDAMKHVVKDREPKTVRDITFEPFEVIHSLRAPAVGYRISAGRAAIFYVPDVVNIKEREAALKGVDAYIGDGATLDSPMVRRKDCQLFGHTTIRAQLGWCGQNGVDLAVFTHCGSQIVEGDERTLKPKLKEYAQERGVSDPRIAHDGDELVL
ncbi:MBL fold metallo-hydrolase [Marinicauda algicola]|uniref:MBL fold metallo-hydrolase n=1 Tax=Marinicauda algicola TaxID=2029849 RepID=A0A4S2GXL6_9PROT|nr:MBL fold metallo-hydrolase [Marinicauda algicola]TGY87804.1 MBL fold metallo-hydrolase [Marinicauda algicola]